VGDNRAQRSALSGLNRRKGIDNLMRMKTLNATGLALAAALLSLPSSGSAGMPKSVAVSLKPSAVQAKGVELAQDKEGLRVTLPRASWQDPAREPLSDRDFMALIPIDFQDGTIEIELKGDIDPSAPTFARGFVGIAFRVADGKFEKIYLRPANGIVDDMVRRNHSVQYAAFPDWRFDRLRREAPERYETAADIVPGRWVKMRIDVNGATARLYLDGRANPVLIVNDLKYGADKQGQIGLWIETGTVAHFRKLKVAHANR
jgi:hypothetical protein